MAESTPFLHAARLPLHHLAGQTQEISLLERFLAKAEVSAGGCFRWNAALDKDGYGWINLYQPKRIRRAHRISYMLFVGDIPPGYEIDHDCHTRDRTCIGGRTCLHRRCVNPLHLCAVTGKVNTLLGRSFVARQAQQTHCLRGHPLAGPDADVYIMRKGGRQCRRCKRITMQRRAAA